MSKAIRALLAVVLVVAVAAVAVEYVLDGSEMCGNVPITETLSPGGAHRAVVFERDCGATTGFSTQVSVLPAGGKLPNDGGNVFVADTDHGQAPSGPGGGPVVEAVWLHEDRLLIRYHRRARVFHSEPRFGGVDLVYEPR